jgi:actin-related protein
MAYLGHDTLPLVIDSTDSLILAGLVTDEAPRAVFPAVIGRPRYSMAKVGIGYKDIYCGDDAIEKRGILTLQYPVQSGIITDWESMEKLWHYTFFDVLKTSSEEHPVLLAEAPLTPKSDREKMIRIMFESFAVPATCVVMDAVLALHASGLTTGLVLQSTSSRTYAVPIYEGQAISQAILTLDIGGRHIAEYMMQMLTERGYSFTTIANREIVKGIVDELDYVALDFDREIAESASGSELERQYELPDGDIITIGNERFRAPEVLFNPNLIGMNQHGAAKLVHDSIMNCDSNIRESLFSHIVLAGSNTMFNGMADRLTKEVTTIAPPAMKVKVVAPADRKYSAWIGGAIVANSSSSYKMWISKKQYEDSGRSIAHLL